MKDLLRECHYVGSSGSGAAASNFSCSNAACQRNEPLGSANDLAYRTVPRVHCFAPTLIRKTV